MKISRRQLLLGTASVMVSSTLPTVTVTAMPASVQVQESKALLTVVNVVRQSLERFALECRMNDTPLAAYNNTNLGRWLAATNDTEVLKDMVTKHLSNVHDRLRTEEWPLFFSGKSRRLSVFAQMLHIHKLPFVMDLGDRKFFGALAELLPDDLKSVA